MAQEHTVKTVEAILRADPTVGPDRVLLVREALQGGLVTAGQAAKFLGMAKRTWFERIQQGRYRVTRIRRSHKDVRYPFADVLAVARLEEKP